MTDHEYRILSLMRVVEVAEETPIAVGQIYELGRKQNHPPISIDILKSILASPGDVDEEVTSPSVIGKTESSVKQTKKKAKKKISNIRNVLRSAFSLRYGPALVDHAIALSQLSPELTNFASITDAALLSLLEGFNASDDILQLSTAQKGYIMAIPYSHQANSTQNDYVFDEFHTFKPAYFKMEANQLLEFDSFDRAVDEFYSKIESQRLQQKARQAEAHAIKKLESVKENSASQIRNFEISQQQKEKMALAIEMNLEMVDSAIKTICSFVASGMDWGDLSALVKEEQEKGNLLALIIKGLKLEVGMITLTLPNPDSMNEESDDSDFNGDSTDEEIENLETPLAPTRKTPLKKVVVDVNIYESAYSNARSYCKILLNNLII